MPTRIIEQCDGETREHWIEHEAVRAGFDPEMDAPLSDDSLPGHRFTLRYAEAIRTYSVRLVNPSERAHISGVRVQAGKWTDWPFGKPLEIGRTKLLLEADGDPRPAPRPLFAPVLDQKGVDPNLLRPETTGRRRGLDSNTLLNGVIVVGLLFGLGLIVVANRIGTDEPAAAEAASLEQLLGALEQGWAGDDQEPRLRRELQNAFVAMARKRPGEAYGRLRAVRDAILVRQANRGNGPDGGDGQGSANLSDADAFLLHQIEKRLLPLAGRR